MKPHLEPESLTTTLAPRWRAYPAYKPSGVDWLGEIPEHWEVRRLKYVARFAYGDALASEVREDGEIAVYGSNGIVGSHTSANTKAPCLIVGRKGSYGKVTYSEEPCFAIDTTFFIDQTQTSQYMRWLYYMLLCLRLDDVSKDSAIPGLAREDAYAYFVALPTLPEQRAIAAFLDRETAKLDALITKKEELIALLQEKRAAIISHAVTQGLDPTAPLKDSGVEWLGQIPAHWGLVQLRRVMRAFVDYRGATPTKVASGIPLITARNIKNGVIDLSLSQEFINEADYDGWMVRGFPEKGDVLVTTEAPLGESAQITDEKIALAQRIILLKAEKSLISNDYLKYYFAAQSGIGELWSRATGSTAIGIKASHLREILITVPPLAEQAAIVEYIDHETAKIDALISTIRRAIEKVQEERTALIAAAVTGKIDAREEGA